MNGFNIGSGISSWSPGAYFVTPLPDCVEVTEAVSARARRSTRTTRGVTLVELLVVVTIMMMLAVFAIPAVRPLTEGRRVREATRALDVYINRAKARSIEKQRPVGLLFERMTQIDPGADPYSTSDDTIHYQADACNVVRMVEIPPPYAGDFLNSAVRIQNWTRTPAGAYYIAGQFVLKLMVMDGDFNGRLLKHGDRVQFNYQGPFFTVFDDPNDGVGGMDFGLDVDGYIDFTTGSDSNSDGWTDTHVLSVQCSLSELGGLPWPAYNPPQTIDATTFWNGTRPLWSGDVKFQFYRQPQPSPVPPLRLPKQTVIDLADSGYLVDAAEGAFAGGGEFPDAFGLVGPTANTPAAATYAADNRGPMILFAPHGAISAVYHWDSVGGNYMPFRITKPVFLMIGKWERTGLVAATSPIESLAEDTFHNWQDASNLWIAIGSQNGLVTTAEVNAQYQHGDLYMPGDPTATTSAALATQMQSSRALAREAQISKGAL